VSNTPGSVKLQSAALVVLVLAIIALLILLFNQQREYRSHAEAAEVGAPVAAGAQPAATPSAAEPSADPVAAVTAAAQDAVNGQEDLVISVLGDGTSDTSTEWVYRWANELGAGAAVTVHTWNPEFNDWFPQTRNYGQGNRAVTIWNASASQGTPAVPLQNAGMIQAEADLTILNSGHWGAPEQVASSLNELLETLNAGAEDAAPVVLTAQNPALETWSGYADTNRNAMRTAAADRNLPVIDIHAAFAGAGDWPGLLVDPVNPGDAGHQLWAETVSAFFAR
jgi:hypothetical protein